ncbi:MAG: succinate--CoA ligase subunit alpha [Hyphomicrobiaceae bacterium]|nr:succinate--CoA ligase subunit alpha [Hyphomicrobiaceae bacterium]
MTILIDRNSRVLVQGATGPMGSYQVQEMLAYGTNVVAGISPGKGGSTVHGVPVFDTVQRAAAETGADVAIMYVAAPRARDAVYEAVAAGIRVIVCVAEYVPVHDAIEIKRKVRETGVHLIGPNCSGLISPGQAKAGFYCDEVCMPGPVGVMSKSGTLSYAVLAEMKRRGVGATTVVGVGGDEIKGTTFRDCIELFEADPETGAMLIIGEIGGRDEEEAAEYIKAQASKPIVAYVSGRSIPPGLSIGHAGAMVVGNKGTYQAKIDALKGAGVLMADTIEDIPHLLRSCHG